MAAPLLPLPNPDLDFLLAEVARALQLTPEQFARAVEHYKAVAEWLGRSGSPLARFNPYIYPQGSMALETTVRPRTREEYDLDLVCHMLTTGMSALEVYQAVYDRLSAHGAYAPKLEKMNRCLRINYAHDFHLDIIPAEPDTARGGTAIVVPDRELKGRTTSNPLGYIVWFTGRSKVTLKELRAKVDPVPQPTPSDDKPTLTIAVQLMKRRRDVICDESTAPRSIVLTTLAADHYQGTDCVFTALVHIVAGIKQRIAAAHPHRITVCNPTNDGEMFCESFEGQGRYEAFKKFIDQVERDLARIGAARGIDELRAVLADVFGEDPTSRAIRSYGERLRKKRDTGTLKFTGAGAGGLAIVAPVHGIAHSSPRHSYYGGERDE